MPVYTYECECGREFVETRSMDDRKSAPCECGAVAKQIIGQPANVVGFQLGWFEHITDEPIHIGSKRELREVTNRYECYATGFD